MASVALNAGDLGLDLHAIATARPAWPVWPQVALERLVGPRGQRLASLDLRWLHRFGALVGLLDQLVERSGGPVGGPSALNLLVERAIMLGHHGWGSWSAGTSCRMLETADGWVAVNLPREDDLDAVAALVHPWHVEPTTDPWTAAAEGVATHSTEGILERARLLGIAAASVPTAWVVDAQRAHRGESDGPKPMLVTSTDATRTSDRPVVVDMTSLWAGPLAGWYLGRAGADVVKVEAAHRPDGAREGTPAFYRRLNGDKTVVVLDLRADDGLKSLRGLLSRADIVLEASRPRAMEAFGIDPAEHVARGTIWCSITGYGRSGPASGRVAFGDDAAVAGGLCTSVDGQPWFIGDAAADPIAGVTAAVGALMLWCAGTSGMVDVAMRDAVAHLTGGDPVPNRAV